MNIDLTKVETWNVGGGLTVLVVRLLDDKLLVISDCLAVLYPNEDAFWEHDDTTEYPHLDLTQEIQ